MKIIDDIRSGPDWFLGRDNHAGPLVMAIKRGALPVDIPHLHRTTHEYFLLLRGTIGIVLSGTRHDLRAGSLLIVEPGEAHQLVASSDDLEMLVMMERYVADDRLNLPAGSH